MLLPFCEEGYNIKLGPARGGTVNLCPHAAVARVSTGHVSSVRARTLHAFSCPHTDLVLHRLQAALRACDAACGQPSGLATPPAGSPSG
eukprot:6464611-Alexandrium_andersonii.AAC.1